MRLADIHILHQSDFYRVVDFQCHCNFCSISNLEYNNSFSISFIRKGFFEYQTFKRKDEIHVGRVLISKPGFEHTTRHIDNQPDIVTIFDFKQTFFKENILEVYGSKLPWVLLNNDIHAIMVKTSPEMEYLHHHIFQKISSGNYNSLEIDERVITIVEKVMTVLGSMEVPELIPDKLKQNHLNTIEAARDFILNNFKENISLQQLANHCYVSPFHFSRIFKAILNISPHQYLSSVRLAHAKVLLTETLAPVADIAYDCGFNSPEHFVTAFKQYYKINPSALRKQIV
ncbi:MAG TPA: AraC family transcriptional regulator [Chitinophagaceae bacterium]|nr:AraC family transcriptional regulator [Chitinophagaceae bacterium]